MTRRTVSVCACAVAAFAMAQSASADLITNGSFETGDTTGWTVVHLGSFTGVNNGSGTAHTGVKWFGMGALNAADQLDMYQDVPTTVGQQYMASFWAYDMDNPSSGTIHVTFGGVDVGPTSGTVAQGTYTQYSLTFTATAATTRLEVTGFESNQWVISDDYSVNPVPAPAALAPLAFGFGFAGLRRRR